MSEKYQQMWKSLGLNFKAHDALLSVLGELYRDTYMSQKNRPKAIEYFDFVISEVHGLRVKELVEAKKNGRKVIGILCVCPRGIDSCSGWYLCGTLHRGSIRV